MAVLIPRIRTIGVRLSEDEYSDLEKFSIQSGARSISDVARTAICEFVRRAIQEKSQQSAVNEHAAQVKDLEQRVSLLTAEIASLRSEGKVNAAKGTHDRTDLVKGSPPGSAPDMPAHD